jgi:hypothetical protein
MAALIVGYLIYRSEFLPRLLGLLWVLGGLGQIVNAIALILAPAYAVFWELVPLLFRSSVGHWDPRRRRARMRMVAGTATAATMRGPRVTPWTTLRGGFAAAERKVPTHPSGSIGNVERPIADLASPERMCPAEAGEQNSRNPDYLAAPAGLLPVDCVLHAVKYRQLSPPRQGRHSHIQDGAPSRPPRARRAARSCYLLAHSRPSKVVA